MLVFVVVVVSDDAVDVIVSHADMLGAPSARRQLIMLPAVDARRRSQQSGHTPACASACQWLNVRALTRDWFFALGSVVAPCTTCITRMQNCVCVCLLVCMSFLHKSNCLCIASFFFHRITSHHITSRIIDSALQCIDVSCGVHGGDDIALLAAAAA